ncbi:hypothetical protein HOY80DRAFT_658816 [Tuber brumale]|nr:hypothetical protein HOY80DRAFT_658816 [Tuber brumale]
MPMCGSQRIRLNQGYKHTHLGKRNNTGLKPCGELAEQHLIVEEDKLKLAMSLVFVMSWEGRRVKPSKTTYSTCVPFAMILLFSIVFTDLTSVPNRPGRHLQGPTITYRARSLPTGPDRHLPLPAETRHTPYTWKPAAPARASRASSHARLSVPSAPEDGRAGRLGSLDLTGCWQEWGGRT